MVFDNYQKHQSPSLKCGSFFNRISIKRNLRLSIYTVNTICFTERNLQEQKHSTNTQHPYQQHSCLPYQDREEFNIKFIKQVHHEPMQKVGLAFTGSTETNQYLPRVTYMEKIISCKTYTIYTTM